ncbi:COG4705 family protein [Kineosporia succinea]|uniref:Membrane-anchored protein n=1 Tax=Kineosporia succinea TaxID=84632 RepID=A0ABT9PCC0_9ACTN|nr:hypothetical protein [Kineosporia succinea]MDP9830351.1 putative membrane-anchored protein [Kineosporia succinea]
MTTNTAAHLTPGPKAHQMLNKVPEITVWFWIIKILCTTVGESFADWINMTLGVGLASTALFFTVVFAVVLTVQMRLKRYVPVAYWLTVVVVSITGTLFTDVLTDRQGLPLKYSSLGFGVLLAVVLGAWYARERTLSIHSIVTVPREAFYWLTVLVTFALGTATGDWTLELTGWGPGTAVLLPAALIALVAVCRWGGGQPVLAFWLAYVLTRPLGANIGDWLATPRPERGLGLGTAGTSVVFLIAIAATVAHLTHSRADTIAGDHELTSAADPKRHRLALGVYAVAALGTTLLLHHTSQQPHADPLAEGETSASGVQLSPARAQENLPAPDVAALLAITRNIGTSVSRGDRAGALACAKNLETLWDEGQSRLQPLDGAAWGFYDTEIDHVLTAVRTSAPDRTREQDAVAALLTSLS